MRNGGRERSGVRDRPGEQSQRETGTCAGERRALCREPGEGRAESVGILLRSGSFARNSEVGGTSQLRSRTPSLWIPTKVQHSYMHTLAQSTNTRARCAPGFA